MVPACGFLVGVAQPQQEGLVEGASHRLEASGSPAVVKPHGTESAGSPIAVERTRQAREASRSGR